MRYEQLDCVFQASDGLFVANPTFEAYGVFPHVEGDQPYRYATGSLHGNVFRMGSPSSLETSNGLCVFRGKSFFRIFNRSILSPVGREATKLFNYGGYGGNNPFNFIHGVVT